MFPKHGANSDSTVMSNVLENTYLLSTLLRFRFGLNVLVAFPMLMLPAPHPPSISLTDSHLLLSIICTTSLQPNPSWLCSGRFRPVLGATLSDGMTNYFSLASLHTERTTSLTQKPGVKHPRAPKTLESTSISKHPQT